MATRKLDKKLVLAQCVGIMKRQLQTTRHPRLRGIIDQTIDYFDTPGRADEYGMIVYGNAISLVHRNYQSRSNLTLFSDGKLRIGRFDSWLNFNDPCTIRIHGDGTADCGICNHGIMTGESLTEKLAYRQGKEIKYSYDPQPLPFYLQEGDAVDNDNSLGLFGRLLRNRTIDRKDFLLGALILFGLLYLSVGIGMPLLTSSPGLGQVIIGIAVFLLSVAGIILIAKRVGDLGFFGIQRVVTVLILLCAPFLLLLLLVLKSRVASRDEYDLRQQKRQELHDQAQQALARRCDVSEYMPDWFAALPEVRRAAADASASRNSGDERQQEARRGEEERERRDEERRREEERREEERQEEERQEEERRREEEYERERRRDELDRRIDLLRSQLSSEEYQLSCARSEYDRASQQADTYLSYARSTDDESLRRDYEQSADSYLSDARSAESDASDAASRIGSLESEISSLESERAGL